MGEDEQRLAGGDVVFCAVDGGVQRSVNGQVDFDMRMQVIREGKVFRRTEVEPVLPVFNGREHGAPLRKFCLIFARFSPI